MKMRILLSALLAGSVLATPAIAEQRKTLLDILFPRAYKERVIEQRRARELREQERRAAALKSLPKVSTSKNYAYKVAKRSAITLKPLAVELASAEIEINEGAPAEQGLSTTIEQPNVTALTKDLSVARELELATDSHLASVISDHYNKNQDYIWVTEDGQWNAKARSVIKVLAKADEYGLHPSDYEVETVSVEEAASDEAKASARIVREISLTNAALRYAMDASFGSINPNLLSGYHDFPERNDRAAAMLAKIFSKALPANTLETFHPDNEKFLALKQELVALNSDNDDVIELERNILLRPGKSHPELPKIVAAIKQRASDDLLETHAETLAAYLGDELYSKELSALVKGYQKEAGLGADGIIGKNTISRLAGISSASKIERVQLAMERLRWLPHQLGNRHVFINQPEYRARYIEGGNEKLSMRVVVGKKSNQTNFFYDEIEHIEYNPYWNVPRSIIVNEFLPKSLGNPGYLDQSGYEVRTWGGQAMSSSSVNWYEVGRNPKFAVRQPPGPRNALGELKIMFPNKHSIYMHDTPAKRLFKKDNRAFSHGCIRLHDPRAMAAAVMGSSRKHIANQVAQGKNLTEKLPVKVPVYVSYFTAWPQADGSVKYFADMYGRDTHLMKAIDATRKARVKGVSS